jgi:hypothetical protein
METELEWSQSTDGYEEEEVGSDIVHALAKTAGGHQEGKRKLLDVVNIACGVKVCCVRGRVDSVTSSGAQSYAWIVQP